MQTMFPESLRSFLPTGACNSMHAGTGKSPSFLIENLLGQESKKLLSGNFSTSFVQSGQMPDFRLLGLASSGRNIDLPNDNSRVFSSMGSAFFPGMPFSYLPVMQDPRHYMQNSRMEHPYPQYGFKAGMNLPVSAMHPFFQSSRPMQHKRKGGQVRFSNDQTLELEKKFKSHKYLTSPQRKKLAKALVLSERQIKTWFQNRRAKWRRLKHEDDQIEPSIERDSNAGKTTTCTSSSASSSISSTVKTVAVEGEAPVDKRPASSTSFSSDIGEEEMCNSDDESVCSEEEDNQNIVDV